MEKDLKKVIFKKDNKTYLISKDDKSGWVYGSIKYKKRHKGWYFCDWGETTWSQQHMKEIAQFMTTL